MFGASAMMAVWAAGFFVVGRDLKSVIGDSDISSMAGHVAAFLSAGITIVLLSRDLDFEGQGSLKTKIDYFSTLLLYKY